MFCGGISQILCNGSNAPRGIREQDSSGGHTGLRLLLLEILPIMLD